ncbi:ComEC/Rec2 family competence protein [Leptolyngbya sp. FACHB-711]|uniref:ComEC/Rec2 family competence protein n=1 Tax=unclassified Leptolyngbya TaxID=2650499 RepID=UPI0016838138|nr:ComEC/Rec2 family competence protein [Leptolyngbya sp. FACHB-711]MBD1849477.1 ComEC/Rec2 family competence protein [Cyanobacteria bacterium FACHB-502]MBD2023210.1 ComEC/Rec2 family competence protein [Leptolyngbya sp. FACHB-711]
MTQISGAIIGLAYLLGLLATGIPGTVRGIPIGSILLLFAGVGAGFIVPRWNRSAPKLKIWLIAALVGFTAGLYFGWRMPEATDTDISRYASSASSVTVTGEIISTPRLTRSEKVQFELEVSDLLPVSQMQTADEHSKREHSKRNSLGKGNSGNGNSGNRTSQPVPIGSITLDNRPVTGRIYVTVPNDRQTPFYPDRIYPGQTIAVTGSLYLPRTAGNPGGFNFRQYLRRNGIFTGLRGETVRITESSSPPFFWSIRRRIVSAQAAGAGSRTGALLSAIVVGRRGVDVPFGIQDAFSRVGLAHVLAASGFQVTLLVGVILSLAKRSQPWTRFGIGLAALIFYVGLTGAEAPAVRAGVMGVVVLLAMTIDRRVKILPVLLFAATGMLLFDPLAIWDLGFQMSFLATLGLIVTVPVLDKWLDWLPPRLTSWITVPTAAYLWLLPLQLGAFGIVSPYSIPINVIASPIVALVSIGGMISAGAGLILPVVGSGMAWLLSFPTEWLIWLAEKGAQLPGSAYAAGSINALQILLLYALVLLVWWSSPWRQNWWLAGVLAILLVAVPATYASTQLRLTVLQANAPVLLVQNQGQTGLVNLGRQKDVQYTVLPLLQRQGINHLDWAIDLNLNQDSIAAWNDLLNQMPISMFFSRTAGAESTADYQDLNRAIRLQQGQAIALAVGQPIDLGSVQLKLLSFRPIALQMQVQDKTWLLLQDLMPRSEKLSALIPALPQAHVLWWSGDWTDSRLLKQVQPQTAIVSGDAPRLQDQLNAQQITTYVTEQDGAVQWISDAKRFPFWSDRGFRRFAGDAVQ